MNLSGFKKVHEDEDKAVLKHGKGHSITIAKKNLSEKHRADLDSLALHAADGIDIPLDQDKAIADASDATAATPSTDVDTQDPTAVPPEATEQDVAQDQDSAAAPRAPATDSAAPAPEQGSGSVAQDVGQFINDSGDVTQDHATEMGKQDAMYAQDLENGHIKPETYHSLFAKKDTAGKIGTIFGLILSGIGSGLTGQPNAALEMMNKEVDNDFQAQKASKENAINFYKLNLQREMNKAQTSNLKADAVLKADNHTKNQMEISLLHDMQSGVDRLPNGPDKAQKNATLGAIKTGAAAQMAQRNQTTAKALSASQQGYETRTNQMHQMGILNPAWETQAKDRESKEIPGIGYSNTPIPRESVDKIKKINEFQGLLNEYEQLGNKAGWRGKVDLLTPSEKARSTSIRNDLISSYNDVKGLTRFTGNEEQLYKDIVPDIGKVNLTGSQLDLLHRLRNSIGTKYQQEVTTAGVRPFSDSGSSAPKGNSKYADGTTAVLHGKPVVFKSGKWTYQ